jgi:hypothetical protein
MSVYQCVCSQSPSSPSLPLLSPSALPPARAISDFQVVKLLARRGADLLARTINTNLPLDEATGSHEWKTASLLKHLMGPDWCSFFFFALLLKHLMGPDWSCLFVRSFVHPFIHSSHPFIHRCASTHSAVIHIRWRRVSGRGHRAHTRICSAAGV